MVIKNLENKIKLVLIICSRFLSWLYYYIIRKYLDCKDNGQ